MSLNDQAASRIRNAVSLMVRGTRLALAHFSYLRAYFRHSTYVRETIEGRRRLVGARRVAVFVHFDRGGTVHDYVDHHLRLLENVGYAIVFVSNAPVLSAATLESLKPRCALILRRENVGYDFGAYKEGIAAIPDLSVVDDLLLANDSVYGPFHHPAHILEKMPPENADLWGATDSWEFSFHLQSYYLRFHRTAVQSAAFSEFWSSVRYVQSKTWVVRRYEIGLTQALTRAGLRCRAAYPYRQAAAALVETMLANGKAIEGLDPVRKEFLLQLFRYVDTGVPLNGTHFFWDYMIARMGFPFIKRDLLQKNPAHIPLVSYWEKVVSDSSDYKTDLILHHLEISLKNRSV
ncbi:rhamnan synthesis F family protein [Pararhodospirillum photometricum]|nr:rhamnan synthesis F family protein [Pararhodospirillum photometricum]